MSIDETGVSLWKFIFPMMNKDFAQVWCLDGFLSNQMGFAEAVPHVDEVGLALVGAEETSQLCKDTAGLSNVPWLQENLKTHCSRISVS